MKTLLIIYAQWHPSNLAGVHRPRLIGNYLKEFGWKSRVLTVEEQYYEETPDYDFEKTFSTDFEVTRVKAFKLTKPRIIGDIGLRAFFQLYKKALEIIKTEKIDFVWIPIPSFYQAVLGRMIYEKTKTPYGIDYIDPWIRDISNRRNIRSVVSNFVAGILEPYALKKASLISGVSTSYYQGVINRNFRNKPIEHVGMPYGFDPKDHEIKLKDLQYPWDKYPNCKPIVYAGAFLPNSGLFIQVLFKAVSELKNKGQLDNSIKFFFIGTGNYFHKSIGAYAQEAGVDDAVIEIRERKPYLHILNYLSCAWKVMIIGSTEKHYTASKNFQSLLSRRPLFAMFHEESSACLILREANADNYLFKYNETMTGSDIKTQIDRILSEYLKDEVEWNVNFTKLEQYSARTSAKKLADKLNNLIGL